MTSRSIGSSAIRSSAGRRREASASSTNTCTLAGAADHVAGHEGRMLRDPEDHLLRLAVELDRLDADGQLARRRRVGALGRPPCLRGRPDGRAVARDEVGRTAIVGALRQQTRTGLPCGSNESSGGRNGSISTTSPSLSIGRPGRSRPSPPPAPRTGAATTTTRACSWRNQIRSSRSRSSSRAREARALRVRVLTVPSGNAQPRRDLRLRDHSSTRARSAHAAPRAALRARAGGAR